MPRVRVQEGRHLGVECPSVSNIPLQCLRTEFGVNRFILEPVDVHDVFRDVQVAFLVALVEYNEEQIETTHDRSSHGNVRAQALLPVVPTTDRVRCCEDGGPSVEGGVNSGFGNGNCLLFHSFVNSNLIRDIHLVELVDGTDTVISEH